MKTLYLAGPDVFAPEPFALGEAKQAICARHGFKSVFPLGLAPLDPAWDRQRKALAVYDGLTEAMRRCDGVAVNTTPFGGMSMDVGTAFEMGFFAALDRPVFAYSNSAAPLVERARAYWGNALREGTKREWRGGDGMEIDGLGESENLMIEACALRSTGVLVREDVPEAERFSALGPFERCVERAAEWFRAHTL